MSARLLLASSVALLTACAETVDIPDSQLATPVGLAVAGVDRRLLFVANAQEDTLQVLTLSADLDATRFVRSEALYFPVRIPAGPRPTKLASTPDGRWVIVLSEIAESLRLVDASTLAPALDASGAPLELVLGPRGGRPTDMVAVPADLGCTEGSCGTCDTEGCVGRVLVTLSGRQSVLEVDVVVGEGGAPRLVPRDNHVVGGNPQRLAVSRDRLFAYVTDGATPDVVRLDLVSGATTRVAVGGFGGPVAVSTDGTLLVVGRPATQDVVVVENASTLPQLRALDTVLAPDPSCIPACGVAEACVGPHPADASICASEAGLGVVAPYEGIYLGRVPRLIATLGAAAGHAALSYTCSGEETERAFSEYAVVISEGESAAGNVTWLSLRNATTTEVDVQVASRICSDAPDTVEGEAELVGVRTRAGDDTKVDPPSLSAFVTPCIEVPAQGRFVCATQDEGGMVLLPGNRDRVRVSFEWEAPLPGLDRPGGGFIDPDDNTIFLDVSLDPTAFAGVVPGDILELEGPFLANNTECLAALGVEQASACTFERRVVEATQLGGRAALRVDAPLPPVCFVANDGRIAYRVRVGNQFLVNRRRAPLGVRYGPGGSVGTADPLLFVIRELPNAADLGACERYDEDGAVLTPDQDPVLRRDQVVTYALTDPYDPFAGGVLHNSRGEPVAGAGSIPGDVVVWPTGNGEEVRVFMTYSGTDGLYGFIPNAPEDVSSGVGSASVIRR